MLSQELHGAQRLVFGLDSFHRQVGLAHVAGTAPVFGTMAPNDATRGSEGEYSHFGGVALNGNIGGSQGVKYSVSSWDQQRLRAHRSA